MCCFRSVWRRDCERMFVGRAGSSGLCGRRNRKRDVKYSIVWKSMTMHVCVTQVVCVA